MRAMIGVAALMLVLPMVAHAEPPANQARPAVRYETVDTPDQMRTGANQNPNEMVCRTITHTGSRLGGRRVCRTRAEWEQVAAAGRDTADEATRAGMRAGVRGS